MDWIATVPNMDPWIRPFETLSETQDEVVVKTGFGAIMRKKRVWERGDRDEIRREVMHRLNAAKGGGFIFQSDHSVAGDVSGQTYDMIVKLVREYGVYPLELGEFDEAV